MNRRHDKILHFFHKWGVITILLFFNTAFYLLVAGNLFSKSQSNATRSHVDAKEREAESTGEAEVLSDGPKLHELYLYSWNGTTHKLFETEGAKSVEFSNLAIRNADTLDLAPTIRVSKEDFLAKQLDKCAPISSLNADEWCEAHHDDLLVFETDSATIIFTHVDLLIDDSNNVSIPFVKLEAIIRR